MGKQHFHLLSFVPRLLISFRLGQGAGNVAGMFMDAARDFAGRLLGAAFLFERARIAIQLAGPIQMLLIIDNPPRGFEDLAVGADVDVVFFIEAEVGAGKGAITAGGFVEHRDVGIDALFIDQPGQVPGRP